LNKSTIRYREGVVAKSDILASTVSLADAKQNYVTTRGEYEKSLANLNNIIGLPTETPLLIRDETNYTTYEPTEESCVEYALENRPDYFSAEYAIKQAEAAIKIAEADRKPRVDASISKTAEGDKIFNSDTRRSWQAGLTLQWNIFDNGVTSAGVNEMRARLRKSQAIATQIADSIRLEVHNDYIDLRTAEENIATTKIAVARAEEDYHLAQIRYTEGVGTNLEVIDAQEKLTQARTNYFSAFYSYYVAKASLEKAMGVPIDIDVPSYISERR
jgi:outer membrane protein TolC